MAALAVAAIPALIGAAGSYFGGKSAEKTAKEQAAAAAAWRAQVTQAASPFLQGSQQGYSAVADALGLNGAAGMQSYLTNSMNPLLAGAQGNALDAMNQKMRAQGYAPMAQSGNTISEANKLLQGMYLNQYNQQVGQTLQDAQGQGGIAASMYGTAGSSLNPQVTAGLASAGYGGGATGSLGYYGMQGATGYLSSPDGKSFLSGLSAPTSSASSLPPTVGTVSSWD
jgi:hypothetical protein